MVIGEVLSASGIGGVEESSGVWLSLPAKRLGIDTMIESRSFVSAVRFQS